MKLRPGLAVSALLVAVAIAKELPITLVLGGHLRPLSFRIYDRYAEAALPDAGLAGLLLVGLALGAFLLTRPWRRHA